MGLICLLGNLYIIAIFGRILLSYFPRPSDGPMAQLNSGLYAITEPVLGPARRIVPQLGMFDLSPIVVFFGIRLLMAALGCRGGI